MIYIFEHQDTGEVIEVSMPHTELDQYKVDNPHLKQIITAPHIVGGVNDRVKTDDGFKSVLSKVAEAHPNSNLADKMGGRTSKAIKTQSIVRKHIDKQTKA
jgi:hypothetical protein|tara:strand:+ start:831 stop:1133 length:303 start_codon:yes stop_codon:yes gene_type:complete